MAKNTPAEAPTKAETVAAAIGASHQAEAPLRANAIDTATTDVVKWGNGGPQEGEEPAQTEEPAKVEGEDKTPAETPSGKTKVEDKPDDDAPEATKKQDKPKEEAEEPVEAKVGERRKQILESLAAERTKRAIEEQVKTARDEAKAAKDKLEEFEKAPLGRKLALVAKAHGMTTQELSDRLLIEGDDVKEPVEAKKPVDPEVEELKKWRADREKREAEDAARATADQVARAVETVKTELKDADLPMVEALDGYGRVLTTAHEAWMAGGKKGTVKDFLADAADIVEGELAAEKPKLAERLKAAKPEAQEAATEEAPKPRPVMGKRTAARPEATPKSVWENGKTQIEVDEEIKRQFGFV